jgi:hypothetical protein
MMAFKDEPDGFTWRTGKGVAVKYGSRAVFCIQENPCYNDKYSNDGKWTRHFWFLPKEFI